MNPVGRVYILRCGDGSLYTGIATDVERRFGEHVSQGPKTAKYLRGRLPLEIVYRREIGSRSEASKERSLVKSQELSKTKIAGLPFKAPDDSDFVISKEYFENARNADHPTAGPFAAPNHTASDLKVWPKK